MKKYLVCLFAIVSCVGTISCKKEKEHEKTYSYYVWHNESSHDISLVMPDYHLTLWDDNTAPDVDTEISLPSEASVLVMDIVSGPVTPPGIKWDVLLSFDDGDHEVRFGKEGDSFLPNGYDGRCNLADESNYIHAGTENPYEDCPECVGPLWTYTFTDADYEAAVAYAEREQK